ncbi:MAG: hypothetical protein FWH19_02465 [Treponema sp.]|nr:hypothetical protein [Treponema sp.]
MSYTEEISINYDSFPIYRFVLHLYRQKNLQYIIKLKAYSYKNFKQPIYNKKRKIDDSVFEKTFLELLNINLCELNQNIEKNIFVDRPTIELKLKKPFLNIHIKCIPRENIIWEIFLNFYKTFDIEIEYI